MSMTNLRYLSRGSQLEYRAFLLAESQPASLGDPGPSSSHRLRNTSFVGPRIQHCRKFSSTSPARQRIRGHAKTHYETLNIPHNASRAEVKGAYFRLSKLYHPDLRRQRQEAEGGLAAEAEKEATENFHAVSEAYKVLGDDRER